MLLSLAIVTVHGFLSVSAHNRASCAVPLRPRNRAFKPFGGSSSANHLQEAQRTV